MDRGILVLGELHEDLYYENDFFDIFMEKLKNRLYSFIYNNPDDISRNVIDRISSNVLSELPKKISSNCFIKRGGNGNNSAEFLARLGVSTKLISVIGMGADWMIKELSEMGIDTSDIYKINELTPVSTIIKSNITTKIFLAPKLKNRMNFKDIIIPEDHFRGYKIIFTTPLAGKFMEIHEKCRKLNLITAFNIELQKITQIEQLNSLLKNRYDLLFINVQDAYKIIGRECPIGEVDEIFKKWTRIRIYTEGKAGSYLFSDITPELKIPSINVQVIDRTGAGDCYAAGFLAKFYDLIENKHALDILLQKENSLKLQEILKECGIFASYTSAYKISKQSAPNKDQIQEFLRLKQNG